MSTSNSLKERELREQARHNREDERLKLLAQQAKDRENEIKQYQAEYSDPRTPYNAVNQGVKHGVGLFGSLAKGMNDFSYYTQYKDLVMNILKQAITAKAGVGVIRPIDDLFYQADYPVLPGEYHMNKNSIHVFDFVPSLGNCNGQQSPTAIAVRELYSKVRAANSGSTNYDAADLFQFPLAMDAIYYVIAWIERGIALVNFVNPREPYTIAYQLLQAHCFNNSSLADDFIYHKNDIITLLNSAIARINALNVPLELSYIKRHVFLAETIFYSGEHVGRSYYLLNPNIIFIYDELNSQLKVEGFESNIGYGGLVPGIRRTLDKMILPLELSQSISIMSGDILKAGLHCINIPSIPLAEGETMLPVLSNDIKYLQSLKNADIINPTTISEFAIQQGLDANNNPFLYQGTWNGAVWEGPHVSGVPMNVVRGDGSYATDYTCVPPQGATDVIVDYYDEDTITEEDQCYNFSFKLLIARDGSTYSINHARSEVIVRYRQFRFDIKTGQLITEIDQSSNVFNFSIDYSDTVENQSVKLHQRCHAANLAAMSDFIPRFYLNIPLKTALVDENYCEVIWNRNRNRNYVSLEVASDILDYTLRSMFCITSQPSSSSEGGVPRVKSTNTDKSKTNKKNKRNKGKKGNRSNNGQNNPKDPKDQATK